MKIADGITKPLIVPLFHGKPCWDQLQARIYDLEDCYRSRASNIESDNSQNFGLEDYNNTTDGIFQQFTTTSLE